MTREQNWEKFMRESNAIEGEFELAYVERQTIIADVLTDGKSPIHLEVLAPLKNVGRLNPGDLEAVNFAIKRKAEGIQNIHFFLGDYLAEEWVGRWRLCDVRVGGYKAPSWRIVPELMKEYIKNFPKMDSWTAHNEFEKIHPFQDLNGRTGRILWLVKALKEGYDFTIPFLQKYYYQTLNQYELPKLS